MSTTLPPDKDAASDDVTPETPIWLTHLGGEWSGWKKLLNRKRTWNRLAKAFGTEANPLAWSLPQGLSMGTKPLILEVGNWARELSEATLASNNGKSKKKRLNGSAAKSKRKSKTRVRPELDPARLSLLREWLDEIGSRPTDESSALEALAWSRALPAISQQLEPSEWGELFETLRHMAHDAGRMPFGRMPLARQLLAGELPLTLACVFQDAEPDALAILGQEGAACVISGMRELLDGEGMVHASALVHQRSLLASWTRVLRIARHTKGVEMDDDVVGQFEWLLRQAIRFTRHDGQQMLNHHRSGRWCEDMMLAAVGLDEDPVDLRAATLLPWKSSPKIKSKCKFSQLPNPGCYSDWAECGVLSAGWSPFDARVAFRLEEQELHCEWNAAGRTWFDGVWSFGLLVDGEPLAQRGAIEEICWHEDEDVNYIELQATFEQGWRVQRQILLDRRHQFVYAADAVLGARPGQVECRMTLPLAGAVKPSAAKETREVTLKSRKLTIDVLPLSLPEWRTAYAGGELVGDREQVVLSQRGQGASLYMPVFVHLNPNRDKRLTWRQLTVAADREIQTPETAVGYRVQFGEFQWVFFRSLAEVVPRTLLGQHVNHEFFAARFLPDGTTDELVAIEGGSTE